MKNDLMIANNSLAVRNFDLPSPENFEAYSRAVNNIPMLSEESEKALSIRWFNEKDIYAAKDLILAHLRLVVKVVKDHRNYGYSLSDLVQEGNIGLMKAVKKFDPNKETRLGSYALLWIEAEIRDFLLSNLRAVKIGGTSALKKLFFGYRKTVNKLRNLGDSFNSNIEPEKIAKELNVETKDILIAESYFNGNDVSWDYINDEGENSTLDYEAVDASGDDWMTASYNNNPEDIIIQEKDNSTHLLLLKEAISVLSDKEKDILISRKIKEPIDSLSVLAEKWEISMERVRQIENEAQSKIMQYLKNKIPA